MTRKLSILIVVAVLCMAFMTMPAFAKSKLQADTDRIKAEKSIDVVQYSFPQTDRELVKAVRFDDSQADAFSSQSGVSRSSLGYTGTAGISSPGMTIKTTMDDWQYFYYGHRVDYTTSHPSIQFAYGTRDASSDVTPTGYGYNVFDPVGGGNWPRGLGLGCRVQSPDAGGDYAHVGVYPDGKIVLGGNAGSGTPPEHLFVSNLSQNACFWGSGSSISDTLYTLGFIDTTNILRHPVIGVQVIGTDTITHVIAGESAFTLIGGTATISVAPIQYFRKVGTSQMSTTTAWSLPVTIDSGSARGDLAVSTVSSKVAVAYFLPTALGITNDNSSDQDVFYRESSDGGLTWGPKVNITNYDRVNSTSYAPFIEKYAMYDTNGDLHILWNGNPYPKGVYDSTDFFFGDFSASLFHWSSLTSSISRVANRDYGLEWNTQVCGFGGFYALYLAFFNVAECGGKLYVTYSGWNDVFGDGEVDDCASSFGTAANRVFQANGEIYLQVSNTLSGDLWDAPRNLTNTKTPGCDSATGGGVCMNDTKLSLAPYGYDSTAMAAVAGGALTFPGAELITVPNGTVTTPGLYLNMLYLEDHFPGQAELGGSGGTDFTSNNLNWARIPCVDPIVAAAIDYSPKAISYPDYITHGTSRITTVTIVNDGNENLTGTIATNETSGPAGWLTTSTAAISVNAGSGNTMTFDVLINANLNINSPGSIVALNGTVSMLTNAPAPRDSVAYNIVNFLVADTVVGLTFDTISTARTSLVVSSNGEMGRNGNNNDGGLNLDYVSLDADCDSTVLVYLYSGGPYVIQAGATDTNISYSMHSGGFVSSTNPKPVLGFNTPTGTDDPGVSEGFNTGTFVNWDTTLAMEKTYFAPKPTVGAADTAEFMIQKLKVYSADGNAHNNLTIGELMDWDINADQGSNNDAFALADGKTVYFQGTDTDTITSCTDNAKRQGAQSILGWYTSAEYASDSCSNNTTIQGSYAARNDSDLFQFDSTTYPGFLWNKTLVKTGVSGLAEATDLHGVMTFVHGYDLGANDTLTFYTVITTVKSTDSSSISGNLDKACEWYDANIRNACGVCGCCVGMTGNVDADPGEIVDIGDLTALIGFLFIPPNTPPVCMAEANTDGDSGGIVDIGDLTALIGFLFIPPNTPPAGCQ